MSVSTRLFRRSVTLTLVTLWACAAKALTINEPGFGLTLEAPDDASVVSAPSGAETQPFLASFQTEAGDGFWISGLRTRDQRYRLPGPTLRKQQQKLAEQSNGIRALPRPRSFIFGGRRFEVLTQIARNKTDWPPQSHVLPVLPPPSQMVVTHLLLPAWGEDWSRLLTIRIESRRSKPLSDAELADKLNAMALRLTD
ncbi:hypothetical protein [Parachitinimonas caeni]|uniref:Uncharacterized protein n=1 Tax=Parachitinimonas caeni TaxID=3031301 RepID=A0ABT7E0E9_9NEIS|nr:hypothetical protein [Parachitinimonas caeni]MDK2125796.1 hypothetical protein [Parachitinimonas caeni]